MAPELDQYGGYFSWLFQVEEEKGWMSFRSPNEQDLETSP